MRLTKTQIEAGAETAREPTCRAIADSLLKRFPGLHYPASPFGGFVTRDGPVAANWLTLLNNDLLGKMGGRKVVSQAMQDIGGHTLDWPGGLILVAPGAPQLGDAETGHIPQGYKQVGALIAGIRGAPEAGYFPGGSDRDMAEFSKTWRARFDP